MEFPVNLDQPGQLLGGISAGDTDCLLGSLPMGNKRDLVRNLQDVLFCTLLKLQRTTRKCVMHSR